MSTSTIDYDALARQHGGTPAVDYDALASQHGATNAELQKPNAGLASPAGPSKKMDSGEGPIARGMTSFETQLSKLPGNILSTIGAKHWPIIDAHNFHELGEDIKSLNPIVHTDTGETGGIDIGATAANVLPLALDLKGRGIAESPIGKMTPPIVRTAAHVVNKGLEKGAPAIGAAAGAAIGHATGIPEGGYIGAVGGAALGKKILGNLRVPGEEFGVPKPIYPGASLPEHPGTFPGAPLPATPSPEILNPALISEVRTLPGQVSPEVIQARAQPIPARSGLMLPDPTVPDAAILRQRLRDAAPQSAMDRLRNRPVPPEVHYTPERPSIERITEPAPQSAVGPAKSILTPIEQTPPAAAVYPPDRAPLTSEGPIPGSREDLAESKAIQEKIRDAGNMEDQSRLRLAREERGRIPTKGELTGEINKPVKLTTTPKATARAAKPVATAIGVDPSAVSEDLAPEWQKTLDYLKAKKK